MQKKEFVNIHHIGRKVSTILGSGILIDIDAGGAYYVEIGEEIEQIRDKNDISLI